MNKLLTFTASAVALFFAAFMTTASAADRTGLYFGTHAGLAFPDDESWNYLPAGPMVTIDVGDDLVLGVQSGYNYQVPGTQFVVGAEGDFSSTQSDGSSPCPNPTFSCKIELDKVLTARARAGMVFGPANEFLVYATGGLATAERTVQTVFLPTRTVTGESKWSTGWTYGGGFEFFLNDMVSIGGKYLVIDLPDAIYMVDAGLRVNADTDAQIATINFNVHLP